MRRLILGFAGRIYYTVGSLMSRLIWNRHAQGYFDRKCSKDWNQSIFTYIFCIYEGNILGWSAVCDFGIFLIILTYLLTLYTIITSFDVFEIPCT